MNLKIALVTPGVVAATWPSDRVDPLTAELAAQLTMLTPDPSTLRPLAPRLALQDRR